MSGSSDDFDGTTYQVLIGSRAFMVDTSSEVIRRDPFRHESIPSQRESLDLTDLPGQGTVNTEGLWRRGQFSWHHGGGQLYVDRKESDDFRFYRSKGIDIFNQNQLTLLPDVVQRVDFTDYNWGTSVAAGPYVYVLKGNANPGGSAVVEFTEDWSSFTTPTGLASTDIFGLATNGSTIWACGATGVYVTCAGGSSWTQIITDSVDHIWWVANRLIAALDNELWDLTFAANSGSALPKDQSGGYLIYAHPAGLGWSWLDTAAGESFIYVCGGTHSNNGVANSLVYQMSVQPSGVNLAVPTEALPLEGGEFAGTLLAYQNQVFVGTNFGVLTCRTVSQYDPSGNAGDLISGPRLPTQVEPMQGVLQPYSANFVSGLVGYDRFVWFVWPQWLDDDGTTEYWALGRLDLGNFVQELQPAYASDLMVASTMNGANANRTLAWDPITNGPMFIVPGQGLYTQDFDSSISGAVKYVDSGWLRSGRFTWGLPDMKTVAQVNVKCSSKNGYAPFDTADGIIGLCASYDQASFIDLAPVAPNTQANPPVLVSPLTPAEEIDIKINLTAGSASNTDDSRPFLSRYIVKALPNVVSGIIISPVIRLFAENIGPDGTPDFSDPYDDYSFLENLRLSQDIFTYKEAGGVAGSTAFEATCVVQQIIWLPFKARETADGGFEGDAVVYLKSIVG